MLTATAFETALGMCALALGEAGVRRLLLPSAGDLRRRLARAVGQQALVWAEPALASRPIIERITRHLSSGRVDLRDIPLDLRGVPRFRRDVYGALRALPPGRTVSYGALAELAGRPGAARAVGGAMAQNPLPLLIPCHRVLPANGALGAFSAPGGPRTKLRLLTLEGADLGAAWRAAPRELARVDAKLGRTIRRVGRCRLAAPEGDAFLSLARSIVHQQVSLAAGRTIFGRLCARCGGDKPSAERLLALSDGSLREAGLSRQKQRYLRSLAQAELDGRLDLERLRRLDDEAVIDDLCTIKGIGRWSAQMFLLFELRRLDVFPDGDLGFQRGIQRIYQLRRRPSAAQLQRLRERWSPYASVASWYCWRALEAGGL